MPEHRLMNRVARIGVFGGGVENRAAPETGTPDVVLDGPGDGSNDVAGISLIVQAGGMKPSLTSLAGYATLGGIFFLMPMAVLPELLPRVLEALPLALADGLRLAPLVTAKHPPFIAVPETPENAMLALLPVAVQPQSLPHILEALRTVNELLLSAGGKRYLAGWLEMNEDAWKRHYGSAYDTWLLAKQRLDPDGVLGSMLT